MKLPSSDSPIFLHPVNKENIINKAIITIDKGLFTILTPSIYFIKIQFFEFYYFLL
jgi:hypothetical protein